MSAMGIVGRCDHSPDPLSHHCDYFIATNESCPFFRTAVLLLFKKYFVYLNVQTLTQIGMYANA